MDGFVLLALPSHRRNFHPVAATAVRVTFVFGKYGPIAGLISIRPPPVVVALSEYVGIRLKLINSDSHDCEKSAL
jgi:hypothetical protein